MLAQSKKVKLRHTAETDLAYVIQVENHSENTPFISQWTFEQHLDTISNQNMRHLIVEDDFGNRIGYIILTGLLDVNKTVYIKRIAIERKGQGFGKEALKLLINWIYQHTETHRLWLKLLDYNSRAKHVYENVGFKYEGTLRDCAIKGDKFISLSVMSLLRHEYNFAK